MAGCANKGGNQNQHLTTSSCFGFSSCPNILVTVAVCTSATAQLFIIRVFMVFENTKEQKNLALNLVLNLALRYAACPAGFPTRGVRTAEAGVCLGNSKNTGGLGLSCWYFVRHVQAESFVRS